MIYDTLSNAECYRGISPQIDRALKVLCETDFSSLALGRYCVDDDIYYNVMNVELVSWEKTVWECHRKHIDIQYVWTDGEAIGVCPQNVLEDWSKYDEVGDCALAKGEIAGARLSMNRKCFAIFFPQDAHRTGVSEEGVANSQKVVIKVRC